MRSATIEIHRWTRHEFEQLGSMGFFGPEERLELLDGEIFHMPPQSSFHSTSLYRAGEFLREIYAAGYVVRIQMPLAIDDHSFPEPDVAVVRGSWRDYRDRHPTTAVLVVEVADSSLLYDRERKRRRYAANGIPEYWIINLSDGCLQLYRQPVDDDYQVQRVLAPHEHVAPLTHPTAAIPVSELLP
jgi:Uma2 family endonuclease